MTGCPNGCARPYNCDIGLVGKAAGKYTVFVGGRLLGDRLNFIYKDMVPAAEVVPTLVPLFAYFKHARDRRRNVRRFLPSQGRRRLAGLDRRISGTVGRPVGPADRRDQLAR